LERLKDHRESQKQLVLAKIEEEDSKYAI